MKIFASVLLSLSLLLTGMPVSGQLAAWENAGTVVRGQANAGSETASSDEENACSGKEEPQNQKEGTAKSGEGSTENGKAEEKETEKSGEGSADNGKTEGQETEKSGKDSADNGKTKGQETEKSGKGSAGNGKTEEEKIADLGKGSAGNGKAEEEKIAKPGKGSAENGKAKKQESAISRESGTKRDVSDKVGKQEQKPGETLERMEEERQASVPTETLVQDGNKKNLVFKNGELKTLDPSDLPEGYHSEVSRKIICKHTAAAINASVKCNKAPSPLNPSSGDLTGGIVLTGKLKGKKYAAKVESLDAGGKKNTVSHLQLKATINAGGIKNEALRLAFPYVCGDGYAGYAYIEHHFAYCPNTDKFYKVAESHVWLGCTRGDDGNLEFHPTEYQHEFNVYKQVANKYKVAYDANGGTGSAKTQNATYGKNLTLNSGSDFERTGYTLTGWNTKKNGTGTAHALGEKTKNLTTKDGGTVTLYAQWMPNTLTVTYNENRGRWDRNAPQSIIGFCNYWDYTTGARDPEDFSAFGLSRIGYSKKAGAEWNTRADGKGKTFAEDRKYNMTDYAPDLTTGSRTVTLYAQWEPNVYTITLDNQLREPDRTGTPRLYDKYETGIFLDNGCTKELKPGNGKIEIPQKEGYLFKGYYETKMVVSQGGGKNECRKINTDGTLNPEDENSFQLVHVSNRTWYAWYDCLVACEDYADIPCDIGWEEGDAREDIGVRLSYDPRRRTATVDAGRAGCMVSLTGQPSGTKVGEFTSTATSGSTAGKTGRDGQAQLPFLAGIPEGAAFRLETTKNGETLHERMVYYQDGRFRTLARLGEQEAKPVSLGGSIAGSAWGTGEEYGLYQYHGCTEIKDVKEPGTVQRYFRYKDVNMAYSGNGATAGKNTLEYNVSLEDMYQFRDNGFTKEQTEKKRTEDGKEYECMVKYSFQGWEMNSPSEKKSENFKEKEQKKMTEVYKTANLEGAISEHTTEDLSTYHGAEPVLVLPGLNGMGTYQILRSAQGTWEGALQPASALKESHAREYINLAAKWNAFPTITVKPGDKLEFYEGEDVTKEDLTRHLTAHDREDNANMGINPDLNDKLRIVKISYPEPENRSQAAYEKTYEKDVPEGFLLDTYYLKLEEGEAVDVLVTFAATDSTGNTTEEEIPVKVKYNHYPEIISEDTFYYLKEEANRGDITAGELIGRAQAQDEEDGDVTAKLTLKDFDPQKLKMQTQSKEDFDVTYQVTDAYKKTTYKTVKVMVWDEDASIAEMPKYYVRYISEKYLDTLEEGSTWREPENLAYLREVLRNGTPMETWDFSHEDVLAVQDWITGDGEGHWKVGQEANREFLAKFAHCRQ